MIDGIKPNYTALAEQYGCDYRTVKAAYEEALQGNKPKTMRTYPSKLDSFKQIIDIKLEDQCTAKSIFKFIQKKGFDGSYSLVRDYCRGVKKNGYRKQRYASNIRLVFQHKSIGKKKCD